MQTRISIFSSPHRFTKGANITVLAEDKSRIQAIYDGTKSYFYCKSANLLSTKSWNKLYSELGLGNEVFYLSKEDWRAQVQRIFYHELQSEWNEDYVWSWGHSSIRYPLRKLVKSKEKSEAEVVREITEQLAADDSIVWEYASQSWPILKNSVPNSLKHRTKKINDEVTFAYMHERASKIKPAKKRMCLVINGCTSSGKSVLSELIFQRLHERGILNMRNVSLEEYRGARLGDKLPRGIKMYEVFVEKNSVLNTLILLSGQNWVPLCPLK